MVLVQGMGATDMTRVLVVGADMEGERVLLERLHRMAGLPMGSLQACRDLDECQLLIVRDSPGLRNAAQRMRQTRPGMRLWVEGADGMLCDGTDDSLPQLAAHEILNVLQGHARQPVADGNARQADPTAAPAANSPRPQASNVVPLRAGLPLAGATAIPVVTADTGTAADSDDGLLQGEHVLARSLRSGIRQRRGHGVLCFDQQPVLAIDFSSAQAVPLQPSMQHGLAEAVAWLAQQLPQLQLSTITAQQYLQYEQQGQRLPLRALLWQAAQQGGDWARLDARLQQGAVIHLQGWPDFRVLARQQDVFRLCSLLVRKPSSQAECVQLLDLSPGMVQSFVHGAFLAGYVRLDQPAPSAFDQVRHDLRQAPAGQQGGGLLARMWRSVRAAARGG